MELSYAELITLEYIEEEPGIRLTQIIQTKANQLLTSEQIRNGMWNLLDRGIINLTPDFRLYCKEVYPNWQRKQS